MRNESLDRLSDLEISKNKQSFIAFVTDLGWTPLLITRIQVVWLVEIVDSTYFQTRLESLFIQKKTHQFSSRKDARSLSRTQEMAPFTGFNKIQRLQTNPASFKTGARTIYLA